MNRHLSTFALLFASAGLIASAYMIGPTPGAAAVPAGVTDKSVARTTTPAKPASTISATRLPVPLLVSRHSTYVVVEPQQEQPTAVEVLVAELPEKATPSDVNARTMIEADGYRNVKALSKGPDGIWHGRAMRGAAEIAISVGAGGDVSAD